MSLKGGIDKENVVHFKMEYYSGAQNNDIRKFEGQRMELEK